MSTVNERPAVVSPSVTPLSVFEGAARLFGLETVLLGILPGPDDDAIKEEILAMSGVPDTFRLGDFLDRVTLSVPDNLRWDEAAKTQALNLLTYRTLGLIVLAHRRTHGCLFDEDGHIVIERRSSQD